MSNPLEKPVASYFQRYKLFVILILLTSDLVGIYGSFYLASYFRELLIPWIGGIVHWPVYIPVVYLGMLLTVVLFAFTGLYPGYGLTSIIEIKQLSKALTLVYGFLGITVYFLKTNTDFPRSIFLFAWVFSLIIIPLLRIIIRNRASLYAWYGTPVFVILNDVEEVTLLESLKRCRRMGWKPILVYLYSQKQKIESILDVPVVSSVDQLINKAEHLSVKRVIVRTPLINLRQDDHHQLIRTLSTAFKSVVLVSPSYELGSIWIEPRDLEGRLGLELHYHLLVPETVLVKRILDLIGASLLLLVTSPLWLLISVLIKLDSQGDIIYRHHRVGKGGKEIEMLKFRTMVNNADQKLDEYLSNNPEARKEWEEKRKLSDDPRLTKVGRWLRKFSLDELPQFWNVIRGEMSLIGPRPVTVEEIKEYGEYASLILRVKPGITGWWQVMGRNQICWDKRTRLEVYYVSNWSLLMDAYIALKTVWVMISGQGR